MQTVNFVAWLLAPKKLLPVRFAPVGMHYAVLCRLLQMVLLGLTVKLRISRQDVCCRNLAKSPYTMKLNENQDANIVKNTVLFVLLLETVVCVIRLSLILHVIPNCTRCFIADANIKQSVNDELVDRVQSDAQHGVRKRENDPSISADYSARGLTTRGL